MLAEEKFRERLSKLIDAMTRATEREVERLYRRQWTGDSVAMDAPSFTAAASRLFRNLSRSFTALFLDRSKGLAESLAAGVEATSARELGESLKQVSGGVTLKTDVVSGAVAEVSKAGVRENVALIKSIPSDYFAKIEGDVLRSIQTGRGMADLLPAIKDIGHSTQKRAELIARDQTSKATTAVNRARMQGLGIKQFEWLHSGGGKEPRKLHQEMNGKIFSLADPPIIDKRTGERGLPGQLINCRCRMSPVISFGEDEP